MRPKIVDRIDNLRNECDLGVLLVEMRLSLYCDDLREEYKVTVGLDVNMKAMMAISSFSGNSVVLKQAQDTPMPSQRISIRLKPLLAFSPCVA